MGRARIIADLVGFSTDSGVLNFGADKEITLTHDPDDGLILKHAATADDSFPELTFQTGDTNIAVNDLLGRINFQAPDEGAGTDAILVAAAIAAISEGDFSSSANATSLIFQTGASETATTKMTLSSGGNLTVTGATTVGGLLTASAKIDLNGTELILDADADTSITADTDDQIDIRIAGADDFTFTANLFTAVSGSIIAAQALTATTLVTSGIIKTDDTTAATSTTDGSLQTDGGLSVVLDAVIGDDLLMLSDASVIHFGADSDVTLTHVADTGLLLNGTSVIQFNDASQSIGAPSNAILDINATDEIELNATLVDLNGNLDVSGTIVGASTLSATTGTFSGVLKTDDTTAATSTTDGSLQTDGGLSVVGDAIFGDDVKLLSDGAILAFGAGGDATLTHTNDVGITLGSTNKLMFNDATQFIQGASGTILDIAATDEIELTATLIEIVGNSTVSGTLGVAGASTHGTVATEHGAGAVATSFAPITRRSISNGVITTKIHFDLTALGAKGGTANDVIGLPAGGNAFIGRNVVANNGIIFRAELACIELPAVASGTVTTDIDIATNSSGTIAFDAAGGTAKLFNTGAMVAGQELSNITPALTANDFFYLVEGDTAATDAVYNAGQFILTLYGHAIS